MILISLILVLTWNDVKLPVESEKEFDDYTKKAHTTRDYTIIASITTILISFRCLGILITQFPALGALSDTMQIASKDLLNIGIILLILALGFAYTGTFLFGVDISDTNNFWKTYERLFYYALGDGDINEFRVNNQNLFYLYYICFCFIFYFLLMKFLISIVSVQYRRLRVIKQLYNEANARIINEQLREFERIIVDLIF